jgi:integrase
MAKIRRRGEAQHQACVARKGYPTLYKTFMTRRDAEKWARGVEVDMERGVFQLRGEADTTTLREALDRYAREVTPGKRGAGRELNRIKAWQRHPLAARSLASIRGMDLAAYRDERLAHGKGPNTVRLEIALISHVYTIARKEWGMEALTNPVEAVRKPKAPPGRNRRLEPGEEQRLLEAAGQSSKAPWFPAIIRLAIVSGMRAGELLSLEWEQVKLAQRYIQLTKTKNGDDRAVPLSRAAQEILAELPRSIKGKVFPVFKGTDGLDHDFANARAGAGIDNLRFHDLRHEAASRFAEIYSAQELAKVMGWRTMQMALRYYHPRIEDLTDKLDKAMGEK